MSAGSSEYRAGRRDERADVVRWLLSAAEALESDGKHQGALALLNAVQAVLAKRHAL